MRLLNCSLKDFCFKNLDFLKAEIVIGHIEIKQKYQKHIKGHMHSSQDIQQNRPDILH